MISPSLIIDTDTMLLVPRHDFCLVLANPDDQNLERDT